MLPHQAVKKSGQWAPLPVRSTSDNESERNCVIQDSLEQKKPEQVYTVSKHTPRLRMSRKTGRGQI